MSKLYQALIGAGARQDAAREAAVETVLLHAKIEDLGISGSGH